MMESSCNAMMMSYNVGSEQGDSSSAEEVDSPRSVVTAASSATAKKKTGWFRRWRKTYYAMDRHHQINDPNTNTNNNEDDLDKEKNNNNKSNLQHNQVIRIKEEELQIGEYLMGDLGNFNIINYVPDYSLEDDDAVWGSRISILPASPLGSSKNKDY